MVVNGKIYDIYDQDLSPETLRKLKQKAIIEGLDKEALILQKRIIAEVSRNEAWVSLENTFLTERNE